MSSRRNNCNILFSTRNNIYCARIEMFDKTRDNVNIKYTRTLRRPYGKWNAVFSLPKTFYET